MRLPIEPLPQRGDESFNQRRLPLPRQKPSLVMTQWADNWAEFFRRNAHEEKSTFYRPISPEHSTS